MAIVSNTPDFSSISIEGEDKFIDGKVLDIILTPNHPEFKNFNDIGKIYFENNNEILPQKNIRVAKPLFSNIKNYPLKNEIVLITYLSLTKDDTDGYYFPITNLYNNPHHNALLSNYSDETTNLEDKKKQPTIFGEYFEELNYIKPLIQFEGDFVIEGRFGNSIRFGSTNVIQINGEDKGYNPWSIGKPIAENGNPITIIRNGVIKEEPTNPNPITENINTDLSSIYLTSTQQLSTFIPSSIHQKSFGVNIEVDYSEVKYPEPIIKPLPQNIIEEPILTPPTPLPPPDEDVLKEKYTYDDYHHDERPSETEKSTDNQDLSPDTELPSEKPNGDITPSELSELRFIFENKFEIAKDNTDYSGANAGFGGL